MFKKETDLSLFLGRTVTAGDGSPGTIDSGFGKSGKVRVSFPSGASVAVGGPVTLAHSKAVKLRAFGAGAAATATTAVASIHSK